MATCDLFRKTTIIKLFGVIPIYEKTFQQTKTYDLTTEEVPSVSVPQQSSGSASTHDCGVPSNDFWSSL